MIRSALLIASSLTCSSVCAAQTFSSPPDVGTYIPTAATYASGTTVNVLGDGSNPKGGTAPVFTRIPEPVDPTPTVPTGYIVPAPTDYTGACVSGTTYVDGSGATQLCNEKKMRTNAAATRFGYDDPIRFWGQPGVSHCHEFFGNVNVNAYSTRQSLRVKNASWAAGGPANATGYWEPCILKVIGGKLYAIPADFNTIYYQEDAPIGGANPDVLQPLHSLLRFILGTNMDDPNDTVVKAEIAAANAQPGTTGRYQYQGNGIAGYACLVNGGNAPVATKAGAGNDLQHSNGFRMADGTDPWEGRCVTTGGVPAQIYPEFNAPKCVDGVNVSSPSGYRHTRYPVKDNVTGDTEVCPNHWYKVPRFEAKSFHSTSGFADYGTWFLSSDAAVSALLGMTIVPGSSIHADWMNGWNKTTLDGWLQFCMGIGATAHRCQDSVIAYGYKLIRSEPSPDGKRSQQVNIDGRVNTADVTQLHQVDKAHASMIMVH